MPFKVCVPGKELGHRLPMMRWIVDVLADRRQQIVRYNLPVRAPLESLGHYLARISKFIADEEPAYPDINGDVASECRKLWQDECARVKRIIDGKSASNISLLNEIATMRRECESVLDVAQSDFGHAHGEVALCRTKEVAESITFRSSRQIGAYFNKIGHVAALRVKNGVGYVDPAVSAEERAAEKATQEAAQKAAKKAAQKAAKKAAKDLRKAGKKSAKKSQESAADHAAFVSESYAKKTLSATNAILDNLETLFQVPDE